ncbi:ATP-dependent DNA helicase RecG [Hydrogenimonas sp.]
MVLEPFGEKLRKAGFPSLLQLAIHTPHAYLDTRPSTRLEEGGVHTLEATVTSVRTAGSRLVTTARAEGLGADFTIVVFHPKKYHHALFRPGMRHTLHGRMERFAGRWQMVNPKTLSKMGEIVPQYRCKLRQDLHRNLVASLVTVANLVGEGLDEAEARLIVRAHRPDGKWLALYRRHGGLGPKTLEALKMAEALDWFKRMAKKRVRFPSPGVLEGDLAPFLARLPFKLTPAQKGAVAAIAEDFRGAYAARRMVVGDVGSGKTMVILASAVMAYPKRSVLMAPTSILARQLYEEAKKWLPDFMRVALVTQSGEEGSAQSAHFVVGTHALLHRKLPEAHLVIVDEQHRFGTRQRQLLEKRVSEGRWHPHFLQFSATPIPRTQAMMEAALVDVTLMEGTPYKKEIATRVVGRGDFAGLLEHIEKETREGRQVLVVYPLVESSEHLPYRALEESVDFWKSWFEGVFVTHGKDSDKEAVLARFAEEGKILLATTVVEVGISLPKLSTIVIVGAERMGLATLHQLRGRVSRTGLKGYCFLFTNDPESPRLEAFAKTSDGFEIARLDLQFRQSGDLIDGAEQSGRSFRWLDFARDETIVEEAKRRASIG